MIFFLKDISFFMGDFFIVLIDIRLLRNLLVVFEIFLGIVNVFDDNSSLVYLFI